MALPALPKGAKDYLVENTVNRLVRDFNQNHSSVTVAELPDAARQGVGARAIVTDANSTTFGSVVAGSGANTVPVYSDGTDWRIG